MRYKFLDWARVRYTSIPLYRASLEKTCKFTRMITGRLLREVAFISEKYRERKSRKIRVSEDKEYIICMWLRLLWFTSDAQSRFSRDALILFALLLRKRSSTIRMFPADCIYTRAHYTYAFMLWLAAKHSNGFFYLYNEWIKGLQGDRKRKREKGSEETRKKKQWIPCGSRDSGRKNCTATQRAPRSSTGNCAR